LAQADVVIVGAGFTGLWTAYYLLRQEPALRVVVLESEIAGFGASGRNGGWCNATMLGLTTKEMVRRWGRRATVSTVQTMRATLDEVIAVVEREGLDVDLAREGVLRVAHGRGELAAVQQKYQALDALGLLDGHLLLDRQQTLDRIQLHGAEGALWDPFVAWLHPAKLVRGLADAVERMGGTIYEGSRVTGWTGERPYQVRTPHGEITADQLVLATEAYSVAFPSLRRRVIPLYSLIVLTEPLTERQWESVGWRRRFTLSSERLSVDYLSRTPDGRIMFGGRGAPYHFGSRIDDAYDRHDPTHAMLREVFYSWFPQLAQVRFSHAWGGPLGVPRDWTPNVFFDQRRGFGGALAYSGQGVAMSNLAGRVLAESITDHPTELSELPFVGHQSRNWEVEPLRTLGIRLVQRGTARLDDRSWRTGRPPTGRTLTERLSRH
jgi:glycine/D-amino acid oxidase-like deaminating enzyme